jgi:protein DJ-1
LLPANAVVTSYPGYESVFQSYTYANIRVAVDHNLITSRGPGTTIEFALEIIRRLAGEAVASRIASDIVLYE